MPAPVTIKGMKTGCPLVYNKYNGEEDRVFLVLASP